MKKYLAVSHDHAEEGMGVPAFLRAEMKEKNEKETVRTHALAILRLAR
jgi:hypothetical protein